MASAHVGHVTLSLRQREGSRDHVSRHKHRTSSLSLFSLSVENISKRTVHHNGRMAGGSQKIYNPNYSKEQ